MPNFYEIRDKLKAYRTAKVLKVAEFLHKKGIRSNTLSCIGLLYGITASFFLFSNHILYTILIVVALILDNFDGPISKFENKKGGWLVDALCDRIVTISIFASIAINTSFSLAAIATIIFVLINNLIYISFRILQKKVLNILQFDAIIQILFIFYLYQFGLYLFLIATLANFFFLLFQLKKSSLEGEFTIANVISVLRPILAIFALWQFQNQPFVLAVSIVIIIFLDALDGIVARYFNSSKYGSFVDIIADRAVELIILFTYAYWGLIPYVFPIIFLLRGFATDFIRILNTKFKDPNYKEPLSIGKADNRFMRAFYAAIKLSAFSIILIYPKIGLILMVIALFLNLYRGLPVIFSNRSKLLISKFLSR